MSARSRLRRAAEQFLAPRLSPTLLDGLGVRALDVAGLGWDAEVERLGRALRHSGQRIVVGPWLTEVGFELLYWIPFVRWLQTTFDLEPERLVVVSRGGVASWYAAVSPHYVEILELFPPARLVTGNQQRTDAQGGALKHRGTSALDAEIVRCVVDRCGLGRVTVLHPSTMYRLFEAVWLQRAPLALVERHILSERFIPPDAPLPGLTLPEKFVAAKFYFNAGFPDIPSNRAAIRDWLSRLAARTPVVLLTTGLRLDDHSEIDELQIEGVHTLGPDVSPSSNLALQTAIVSRASAFVGTYGGFSYLAPLYGIDTIAVYSELDAFLPHHLHLAQRSFNRLSNARYIAVDGTRSDPVAMLAA